jgi:hypothetical protein
MNYADFDNKNNPWRVLNLPYAPEKSNINTNNFKKYELVDLDPDDLLLVGDADTYTYEYNADNYPVKRISQGGYVAEYEYLETSDPGGGNGNGNDTYTFTIEFKNNYVQDYIWLIFYSLDGSEIIETRKIFSDGEASFELPAERVTFTMIRGMTSSSGKKSINLTTDINVPGGKLIFNGNNYTGTPLGSADFNISFAQNNYEDYILSLPNSTYNYYIEQSPILKTRNIYILEPNQKISSLCMVYNDQQEGLYGYVQDQDFILNESNPVSYTLNKSLETINTSSNKPVDYLSLYAYKGSEYLRFTVGTKSTDDLYTHNVLHAAEFPGIKSGYYAGYRNNDIRYTKHINNLDNFSNLSIDIPDASIDGSYDQGAKKYYNIQVSGNADQIAGEWNYYNDEGSAYWVVYQHASASEIAILEIPANIKSDIEFDPNLLIPYRLMLLDYNTTQNFDEIIEKFFKQDRPFYEDYQEYFSYSKYIENSRSNDKDSHPDFDTNYKYPY